jgi:hypothetical protein
MGGPFQPREVLCGACAEYRAMAPVADGDLVVVATNPALLVEAGLAWPGARLLIGSGPDGADLALMRQLGDARWIARRFDQVVIGSGDGIFASTARAIRQFGIAVGVVGREGGISKSLLHNTDFCRLISDPMEHRVVA